MTREVLLGIDFGTSYTSAGCLVDGRVELVLDSGDPTIPSVVHVPERGGVAIGRAAVPHLVTHPGTTVASAKRLMGIDLGASGDLRRVAATLPYRVTASPAGGLVLHLGAQEWAVEQVAAAVLDRVRHLAEQRFGAVVRRAVVTASAVASPGYRRALERAVRLAHLELLEVVAEPIAGALAFGVHGQDVARRLLICDFGGGTFDVSALAQEGLRFRVAATGGDAFLGGDDLDQALVDAVASIIYRRARFDLHRDAVRRQHLTLRCEAVKRALSTAPEARLSMRDAFLENHTRRDLDVVIERSWAEALWAPLLDRALAAVDATLARARWRDEEVDQVVLIGGTSLVPRFQALVRARFDHVEVTASELAGVAVAMGATILTARHGGAGRVPVLEPAASPC